MKYSIDLTFEQIRLPPFQDILILAKNSPQGKIGLSRSFELLVPNGFKLIEVEDELVEAVFVHKNILQKVAPQKILKILGQHVFPFIAQGEIIRVDVKVIMSVNNIEVEDDPS